MIVLGQESIAALFGVTTKTINEWQAEGFPVARRGGAHIRSVYDTKACIAWLVQRELSKVSWESPADRLARVKADKIEMENADKRNLLIPEALLEPRLTAAKSAATNLWQGEPERLAREVQGKAPAAVEGVLADAFDRFLSRLSQWPKSKATGGGEDGH